MERGSFVLALCGLIDAVTDGSKSLFERENIAGDSSCAWRR